MPLKDLIKNRDLVIQKADKGNIVVILNKNDYTSKMKIVLSDSCKFKKLSIDQNKDLNHIVYMENRIIDVFKKVKNKEVISEKNYEYIYRVGSIPGILYSRPKIHKSVKDGVPPFRPILSVIGISTYKLSKFLYYY